VAEGNSNPIESRTVWLFGSPRSGSTWLLLMAGQHPAVAVMNEPTLGYHLSPFLSNEPGYRARDLDLDTFTIRRVMAHDPQKFFAEKYADVWVPGLRRLINDRLRAHLEHEVGKAISDETLLLVKEPNGSQSADLIMRAQPTARLLFLLRDGRDVVDSELASFLVGSWQERHFAHMRGITEPQRLDFVERSAYQWLWRTEVVEGAFQRHRGPKHLVRYEDMLREPKRHLAEFFDWMGLALDVIDVDALVDRVAFERLPVKGADQFNRSATPGAWRENLTPDEASLVEEILGPKLRRLGYD
jgi:hypothetical protein